MVHSAATVARPRSRNLRALCCSLMIPKTGSTSCFLSRYASLAANVVLQARWRRSTPSWRPIARLRPGSRTDSEGRARLADQTATEDEPFSYTVPAFTDPDDDALTYAAAQSNDGSLPGWLSFNTDTRTLSGTPEEADTPATLTISITASDGTESTSATLDLASRTSRL